MDEGGALVVRAIINQPALLLADEPTPHYSSSTDNLDSVNQGHILDIFDSIHQEGTILIVVSHNHTVADHANELIEMSNGGIDSIVKNDKDESKKMGASSPGVPYSPTNYTD